MIYHPSEHNVYITTRKYGPQSVIDDGKLYDWAQEGATLKVTMRIGWSHSENPEIKYWKAIDWEYDEDSEMDYWQIIERSLH